MVSRLTRQMMQVVQSDPINARGMRNVTNGDITLLQDFDFNLNSKLGTTLYAPFTAEINRVTGSLIAEIPAFVPASMVAAPGGATHFKLHSAGVETDFVQGTNVADVKSSDTIALDNVATTLLTHSHEVTPNSTHPLFILLGIEFFQEVNGSMYPLKNGAFNALAIVKASGV